MHRLTCLVRPLCRKRSELWRENFPTVSSPMKPQSCLAFLPPPPRSVLLLQPLIPVSGPPKGERDPSISGNRWAPAPPPASCLASYCFYLISQPCCHGTEDGTSTLVLNDLLDDSLLVRHSCLILLKCKTERNELQLAKRRGVVLIWAFYSE